MAVKCTIDLFKALSELCHTYVHVKTFYQDVQNLIYIKLVMSVQLPYFSCSLSTVTLNTSDGASTSDILCVSAIATGRASQ